MSKRRALMIVAASAVTLILPLGFLLQPLPGAQPPWRDEVDRDAYQVLLQHAGQRSRAELETNLAIVDPARQLRPYLTLANDRALIYAEHRDPEPTVVLSLRRGPAPPAAPGSADLAGRRILIDPGHFGGAWSQIENRHRELESGKPVREGNLTWATARLLEERLRAAGAEVRLTRSAPPTQPFSSERASAFDAEAEAAWALADLRASWPHSLWFGLFPARAADHMLRRTRDQLQREEPFQLFNRYDLRRRAVSAESWSADLLLSIHFNTMGPKPRNGVMVFVPGNFLPGELTTRATRLAALRRAVDGRLPDAIDLARSISRKMQTHLELGPLPIERKREGSIMLAMAPDDGVYARNLAVLRRSEGLALLVEGPCVDEPMEYQRMLGQEVEVDGERYPRRVEQMADAMFEGLAEQAAVLSYGAGNR